MSRPGRIVLGATFALASIVFALIGWQYGPQMPKGSLPFYLLSALCAIIVLACVERRTRCVTLRIIGAAIFVTYVAYAIEAFGTRDFRRALVGLAFFGLPSAYLMITGGYPGWGGWSEAFESPDAAVTDEPWESDRRQYDDDSGEDRFA